MTDATHAAGDDVSSLQADPLLSAIYAVVESAQEPEDGTVRVSNEAMCNLVLAVDEVHARENAPGIDLYEDCDDRAIPEDAAIKAAHPLESGRGDLYTEAMRLVGAKRSKGALVELVNWLLSESEKAKRKTKGKTT